jgi:hypothetical protein
LGDTTAKKSALYNENLQSVADLADDAQAMADAVGHHLQLGRITEILISCDGAEFLVSACGNRVIAIVRQGTAAA